MIITKLTKVAAYALLGYVAYELYLGMKEESEGGGQGSARQPVSKSRRNVASGNRGSQQVLVEGANGERRTQRVGAGVKSSA